VTDASELVVVRAFSQIHETNLAWSALDAAGVAARVTDDNTVAADWLLSNAIGGVKLLVRAEDFTKASEILESTASVSDDAGPDDVGLGDVGPDVGSVDVAAFQMPDAEDPEDVACKSCGGRHFVYVTSGRRLSALTWLTIGFPIFPVWRRERCAACSQAKG
jgi:hypothetical protein